MQGRWQALCLALIFCRPALASSGTTGAAFLDIPTGAGPAAMGSAYSALATDAYAPAWNPAGLGFLDSIQVAAQHVSYLQSINDEFISGTFPLRPGNAIGFSAQYIGSGSIDATDANDASLGTYSNNFSAYSLAYGHAFTERFSLGVTGKVIHESLADVSANAYAADVGVLWKALDHLKLAAVETNAGSGLKFDNESDNLPLAFHLGAAWEMSQSWLLSAEEVVEQGAANERFGLQWRPIDAFSIRAGYRTDNVSNLSGIAGFSAGIGLNVWGQEFQYAWVPYGDLGDSQYFSIVCRFGATEGRNLKHSDDRSDARPAVQDDVDYQQMSQLLKQGTDQ